MEATGEEEIYKQQGIKKRRAYWYARDLHRGRIKRPDLHLVHLYGLEPIVQQLGLQYYTGPQVERRRARTYAWHIRAGHLRTPNPELVARYNLQELVAELGIAMA